MSEPEAYRRPKGTYDVFPGGANREPHERPEMWAWIESTARETFRRYNYSELRPPVFEEAALFARSAGEDSDIVVQKEMFGFADNAGRELALRPEGTPGAIRAYIEHGLYKLAQPVKLFYMGPMFRQERQQRGRFRQHNQIGVEVLGSADPLADVEVIALLYDLHRAVGVREESFYINNLGDAETRRRYVPELRSYLHKRRDELDADSVRRLQTNPLRTFDSKSEGTQGVLADAPLIGEFLSDEAHAHLDAVKSGLDALGIPYEVDERLVRGLDYYTSTVFEAKSTVLGAQSTVGAGGRYNGLVQELGGPDMPGIGFGTGVERILLAAEVPEDTPGVDLYFVTLAEEARLAALGLASALRREGLACEMDYAGRSAKGQFKQADRSGASWTVIIGEEELSSNVAKLRDMNTGEEREISIFGGHEELMRAVSG